jgi:putative MATE family efflux protein
MTAPATTPTPTTSDPPASDILAGPLDRPLVRLAVPMLFGYLAHLAFNLLNMWFVEHLSEDALAAVSASSYVVWGMIALGEIASVGTLAVVARAVGARDAREAASGALGGMVLGLLLGVGLAAAGPWVVPLIVRALGLGGGAAALTSSYLQVLFWAFPGLAGFLVLESICRAAGRTVAPMVVLALTFALNALLDWWLIFGAGPFPALGVEGAAIATGVARALGFVALLGYVVVRREALGLAWPGWDVHPARLLRIVRIGLPASAGGLAFSGIYVALNALTAGFGTAAVAALGVGLRLEGLAFIVAQSIGRAAATMAGQNLGARQVERARAATRRGILHGWLVMVPLTIAMVGFPEAIAAAFVPHQPEVAVAAASYLRIAGLALFGMVLEVVLENVAGGVGDTLPAMVILIVGTALRIPIAHGLALAGLGYHAVWWAVASTCMLKGLCMVLWFRSERWTR